MSDQTIIGEIGLVANAKLVFSVSEWHGRQYAGVRKFVATQNYSGPTKSGLSMTKNVLRDVMAVLVKLEKTIPPREEHEFGRVTKSETEHIRIGTLPSEDDEGLPAVDVREFVESAAYQGPTKSGIRFRWNLLPEVIACFREQVKVMLELERNEPSLFGTGAFAEPESPSGAPAVDVGGNGFADVLGEEVKVFPDDFIEGAAGNGARVKLPAGTLRLVQENTGAWVLRTEDGVFSKVRNPAEGNFILYAQLRRCDEVVLPAEMIQIFKTVKGYENYVRSVRTRLMSALVKKARQQSVAEYEAKKKFQECGLPWLGE